MSETHIRLALIQNGRPAYAIKARFKFSHVRNYSNSSISRTWEVKVTFQNTKDNQNLKKCISKKIRV